MKIKYRHISEPDIEKTFDVEKAYRNRVCILSEFSDRTPFEEWSSRQLECFQRNKDEGIILDYWVDEENNN